MVTCIEDNIYRINVGLPQSPLKNINAYVIKGEKENLLIDTGYRRDECLWDLMTGLQELGVSMDNTDIFLTHMHSDHCGLAPDIIRPGRKIFISSEDGPRLMGFGKPEAWQNTIKLGLRLGFSPEEMEIIDKSNMKTQAPVYYEDYTLLDDGAVLHYGGRDLKMIITPGHTPGHACLWDNANRVMFLGDEVLFDITPNITTSRNFPDPLGHYIYSLLDISGYPIRLALPAHRSLKGSVADRIGSIIEHHGVRVREVLEILDKHPGETPYNLAGYMSWNIKTRGGWKTFPIQQKWFAVNEGKAHLEYLMSRERARLEVREDGVETFYSTDHHK